MDQGIDSEAGHSNCYRHYCSMSVALQTSAFVLFLCHWLLGISSADNFYLETRGEVIAGGSLNLGELVDAPRDSESDLSPVRVGFIGGIGYQRDRGRFGIDAGFGTGGLDLDRIESIYLGSPTLAAGDTVYLSSGVSAQYLVYQDTKWSVPLGVRLGWARLSAASPVGAAELDILYGELGVGLSYQFTDSHSLTLGALAQSNRTIYVLLGEQRKQRPVDPAWFRQAGFCLFYRFTLGT